MALLASPLSTGPLTGVPSSAEQEIPLVESSGPRAADAGCHACPHPLSSHDSIGLRFCRATMAGAIVRGCICSS